MKKITLLLLVFISLSVQAQFKFGGIGGVGVSTDSKVIPMDSFVVVGQLGPLLEYGGTGFSIRTGAVFQSDKKLMIPFQAIIKSSRRGGFIGLGVSFDAFRQDNTMGSYDFILGNKIARNIDFSVAFSYPFKGTMQDSYLSIRMCMFPLSTCKQACGF